MYKILGNLESIYFLGVISISSDHRISYQLARPEFHGRVTEVKQEPDIQIIYFLYISQMMLCQLQSHYIQVRKKHILTSFFSLKFHLLNF